MFSQDSLPVQIKEEVVITATRIPVKISNIAVPISIISSKQILQTGALKLTEIFSEQTGMLITNGSGSRAVGGGVFGNGLQIQGLSPDHTLILIDGEPVNGRQGGVLDLSRIVTGNIRNIEIIKGPYSSLYGSEAMGAVVNIITGSSKPASFETRLRAGSFSTIDAILKKTCTRGKWQEQFFADAYTSNGYNLNKTGLEKTLEPGKNISVQDKITVALNDRSNISFAGRYYYGIQQSRYAVNAAQINITGAAKTEDLSTDFKYIFQTSKRINSKLTLLWNRYRYNQQLDSLVNGKNYYADHYKQYFIRAEQQTNFKITEKLLTILGFGYTYQQVATERYLTAQHQNAFHFYWQNEISKIHGLNLSIGTRFDYNPAFHYSINPKIAAKYRLNSQWRLTANIGSGFKAPDFRQLYLNFVNNTADSYIIYGVKVFSFHTLQEQLASGYIASILPAAGSIAALVPEQSIGYNAGVQYIPVSNLSIDLHLFRNDIRNLIQYIEIAKRPNGASVFSYVNINKSYTMGGEFQFNYNNQRHFEISGGYGFLLTADKAILENIKKGTVYGRWGIATPAKLMGRNDYFGLQGRSKHTANIKCSFSAKQYQFSTRVLYRSKWGVLDYDGNGFANMPEELAKGFLQVNSSITHVFKKNWEIQFSVLNLTNYTDARNLTNLPGIGFSTCLTFKL
jgi:outer membrane receptor for ferrienterochelin and colicins